MKKRVLLTSLIMALIVIIAISTATYAWFSNNSKVQGSSIFVTAHTDANNALTIGWLNSGETGSFIESNKNLTIYPMAPDNLYSIDVAGAYITPVAYVATDTYYTLDGLVAADPQPTSQAELLSSTYYELSNTPGRVHFSEATEFDANVTYYSVNTLAEATNVTAENYANFYVKKAVTTEDVVFYNATMKVEDGVNVFNGDLVKSTDDGVASSYKPFVFSNGDGENAFFVMNFSEANSIRDIGVTADIKLIGRSYTVVDGNVNEKFEANVTYYKKNGDNYIALVAGEDYNIGDNVRVMKALNVGDAFVANTKYYIKNNMTSGYRYYDLKYQSSAVATEANAYFYDATADAEKVYVDTTPDNPEGLVRIAVFAKSASKGISSQEHYQLLGVLAQSRYTAYTGLVDKRLDFYIKNIDGEFVPAYGQASDIINELSDKGQNASAVYERFGQGITRDPYVYKLSEDSKRQPTKTYYYFDGSSYQVLPTYYVYNGEEYVITEDLFIGESDIEGAPTTYFVQTTSGSFEETARENLVQAAFTSAYVMNIYRADTAATAFGDDKLFMEGEPVSNLYSYGATDYIALGDLGPKEEFDLMCIIWLDGGEFGDAQQGVTCSVELTFKAGKNNN